MLYPDFYILTNDEHCTVTPETHKYETAAGSFCFVTTANGEQQDINNLTTIPSVQRSLCLEEVTDDSSSTRVELPNGEPETCWNVVWPPVEQPQEQEPKCGLAHEKKRQPRKYEDTTSRAKHLEWQSWIDNEVFDLVDLKKFKPKNYVTNQLKPTSRATSTGHKARWVLRGFQD